MLFRVSTYHNDLLTVSSSCPVLPAYREHSIPDNMLILDNGNNMKPFAPFLPPEAGGKQGQRQAGAKRKAGGAATGAPTGAGRQRLGVVVCYYGDDSKKIMAWP